MTQVAPNQAPEPLRLPSAVGDRGGLYPRWPFLAALLLTPTLIVGEAINLYFLSHACTFGGFWCRLDSTPDFVQGLGVLAVFGLLWLAFFVFGVGPLEIALTPTAARPDARRAQPNSPIWRVVWQLSNFERFRHLLIGIGVAALLLLALAVYLHDLSAITLPMGLALIIVGLCALVWKPDSRHPVGRVVLRDGQGFETGETVPWVPALAHPGYIFRTLPLIDRLWPPPWPAGVPVPAPPVPVAAAPPASLPPLATP